jgi:hypothetical protein
VLLTSNVIGPSEAAVDLNMKSASLEGAKIGGLQSLEDDTELQQLKKKVRSQAFACDGRSFNVCVWRNTGAKLRIADH